MDGTCCDRVVLGTPFCSTPLMDENAPFGVYEREGEYSDTGNGGIEGLGSFDPTMRTIVLSAYFNIPFAMFQFITS